MSRKPLVAVVILAAAIPAGLAGAASSQKFDATMKGSSEVPKSSTKATGYAEFTVAPNGKSIRYEITAKGLSGPAQASHLHLGRPGQAGGVLISISTEPFSLPREGRLTAKQFTAVGNVKTFARGSGPQDWPDVRQHPYGAVPGRRDPRPGEAAREPASARSSSRVRPLTTDRGRLGGDVRAGARVVVAALDEQPLRLRPRARALQRESPAQLLAV